MSSSPDGNRRRRVAIVVQRYGEEVNGGAELHARWLAEHLLSLAEVHVITTCALDYTTWADHYPAGDSTLHGVHLHRFPVGAPRDWRRFQRATGRLFLGETTPAGELAWMQQQGPFSTPLLRFVDAAHPHFDAFIFFTYLYATTYFGLPLAADKAILVPTAHDEPSLHLSLFRGLFHLPRVIVYNTATEKALVNEVTRNGYRQDDIIAGIGINVPAGASAARFRQKYGIQGDFLLYVGRIDESKNVPALLDHFTRYRAAQERPVDLVLIGKAGIRLPQHPHIRHLGFLPEQDKFDAIAAAAVVVIPSLYESLSMITLEAWLMGTPVLVNGRCRVLKDQCRASNGGLYYHVYEEFAAALTLLLDDPAGRERLGRQGRAFARAHYDWDVIVEKYRRVFAKLAPA